MSEFKLRHGDPVFGSDPRLLSVPNLCSMYEDFSKEFFKLSPDDPENSGQRDCLQAYMDFIIDSLRIRLAENRVAERDLGLGSSPYDKEETE